MNSDRILKNVSDKLGIRMPIIGKPPVILRDRVYGVSAEGEAFTEADISTFTHAVDSFGFLVEPGERLTGAQWITRIGRAYDTGNPRTAEVARVIAKVMLVDRFADDQLLFDEKGQAVMRGRLSQVIAQQAALGDGHFAIRSVAQSTSVEVDAAMLAMARRDAESLGGSLLPVDASNAGSNFYWIKGFKVMPGAPGDLLSRMSRLLEHSPVGTETFSADENGDYEAQCELATRLVTFLGYENLVTAQPAGFQIRHDADPPDEATLDAEMIGAKLGGFAASLAERGWAEGTPVFLCRRAPIVGAALGIQEAFESFVHPKIVGFRLPNAMVSTALSEALPRLPNAERMR